MAVPLDVTEEIKGLLDPACTVGVRVKLERILLALEKVGLAYKAMISPKGNDVPPLEQRDFNVQCTQCALERTAGVAKWPEERLVASQFFGDRACS